MKKSGRDWETLGNRPEIVEYRAEQRWTANSSNEPKNRETRLQNFKTGKIFAEYGCSEWSSVNRT